MKLKFKLDEENQCYDVLAKRKLTGKYEKIGTCHLAATKAIENGDLELIQTNIEARP